MEIINSRSPYQIQEARRVDKARLLGELRELLNNKPVLWPDLLAVIKPMAEYGYATIPELLLMVNQSIYPMKVIQTFTPMNDYPNLAAMSSDYGLKMIDTTEVNTEQQKIITAVTKLQPINYDKVRGIFLVPGLDPVKITNNGKIRRKDGKEYAQCRLMRMLFDSVNSMSNGVKYTKFLSVSEHVLDNKKRARVKNIVDEINRKVSETTDIKKLIKMKNDKAFINNSYL